MKTKGWQHRFEVLLNLLRTLAEMLFLFVWIGVITEALLRYFFNYPMDWVYEVSEYALVWIAFLGAAWVLRQDSHIKVDLLMQSFSPRMQKWLKLVSSAIGCFVSLVITLFGFVAVWDLAQRGVLTPTPLALSKSLLILVIPIGMLLMMLEFIRKMVFGVGEKSEVRQQ